MSETTQVASFSLLVSHNKIVVLYKKTRRRFEFSLDKNLFNCVQYIIYENVHLCYPPCFYVHIRIHAQHILYYCGPNVLIYTYWLTVLVITMFLNYGLCICENYQMVYIKSKLVGIIFVHIKFYALLVTI